MHKPFGNGLQPSAISLVVFIFSRSITRQYFRKADAVVVVYDVTNESSFLNAKHWILSAKEAICNEATEDIVFLLLANKVDLAADDDTLRYKNALTLSTKLENDTAEEGGV